MIYNQRFGLSLSLIFGILAPSIATAAKSICHTSSAPSANHIGACADRRLPKNRTRNLYRSSIHLECSSDVDHFIRTAQPFTTKDKSQTAVIEEWLWLSEENDRDKMQKWRQEHEGLIQWKGNLPYTTIEMWSWEDCVLGYDAGCPWEERWVDQPVYNKDGKQTGTKRVKERYQPPCYHDETQHESRHCSDELMTFDAEFVRPSRVDGEPAVDSDGRKFAGYVWNPRSKGYYDVLPNKYDLLPGEIEDVQIYSNSFLGNVIIPIAKVGDAWNQYKFDLNLVNHGASASCEMRRHFNLADLHLKARVFAEDRIIGKATPNAFRAGGMDAQGNKTDSLAFNIEYLNGKTTVRTNPYELRLVDTSSFIIEAMSRQSRQAIADREAEKLARGEGSNTTPDERKQAEEQSEVLGGGGFNKDTRVRVKLWEIRDYARDIRLDKLYTDGARANRGSYYLIPLDKQDSLYEIMGMTHHLKPGRAYQLTVAMYNHGVPFYRKENSGINALEGWYSGELPIDFSTPAEMTDERGFFEKYVVDHANASTTEKWQNIWSLLTGWMRK